jgi:hypothetical protein
VLFLAIVVLALGWLLLYSGFTNRSALGEVKSVFSGKPVAK